MSYIIRGVRDRLRGRADSRTSNTIEVLDENRQDITNSLEARYLTPEEIAEYAPALPTSWSKVFPNIVQRITGLGKKPEGSGMGYVMSPYLQVYSLTYGLNPIVDLPKYRVLYRNEADIKQAIDMQAYLIAARPFRIEYGHKEAREFIEDMCDRIDLNHNLIPFMKDGLAYGTGYMEIGWNDKKDVKEVGELPKEATEPLLAVKDEDLKNLDANYVYTINALKYKIAKAQKDGELFGSNGKQFVANKVTKRVKSKKKKEINGDLDIVSLKPLDSLYIRPRVDAWGNFYGFLQWLDFPPMLINNDCMLHYRHNIHSWAYEVNFGTSILMPLIRNNDLLRMFENDAAVWMHYRAVPPLVIKGGSKEHPYDPDRMKDLMARFQKRTAATTIFTKGDVEVQELKGAAAELEVEWWLNHILRMRRAALGVPPHLLGQPAEVSATASEVMLADFVSRMEIYREQMSDIIINQMFMPLIKGRWGGEVVKKYGEPRMVWQPIFQEDRNTRLARVMKMVPARIYTINEARRECGLESLEEAEYDKPVPAPPQSQFGGQIAQTRGLRVNSPSFRPMAKIINDIDRNDLTNKLSGVISELRVNLGAGDMLVKDIRVKAESKASYIIGNWKNDYDEELNKEEMLESFMKIVDKVMVSREGIK